MHYDYIIAGAGCAGLSLAMRMVLSGRFQDKTILLADKAPKQENDRTWCFWETEPDIFESIVYRHWGRLHFHTHRRSLLLDIAPYRYKMIRGIDFYTHCMELLAQQPNIDIRHGAVNSATCHGSLALLQMEEETFSAGYIFSSLLSLPLVKQKNRHYLLQHFKGWTIETDSPAFDTTAATLMDFRTGRQQETGFVYLLPLTENRAMVEFTMFSEQLLEDGVYERELRSYLDTYLPGVQYRVLEEETGKIPMTNHRFAETDGRVVYIGTAGGQTKPSTGYTFRFIQQHTRKLVDSLVCTGQPYPIERTPERFLWYDTVLLRVLKDGGISPAAIFERLFAGNSPQQVLSFLDNSSSLPAELKIIASLPKLPFIKAAARELDFLYNQKTPILSK